MTSPATLFATDARHRQLLASHISNDQTNDHEVGSSSFASRVGSESSSFSSDSNQTLVTNSMSEEEHVKSSDDQIKVKDPRIRARKYQLELCKKAVQENIIVYLGTGYGKTHIAVLLIYELGHLIKKPQKNVCVFLAPTVPLVQQQASVIEEFTDFKVGSYYGQSKRINNHQEWEKEIEEIEVLVMTPQILLHNLFHRLIKMELIALLIFDECHHAQAQSSHPYAQIMKEYKISSTKRPRIFGMTASPIVGKGGECLDSLPRGINSLEELLDAKVCSVEDSEELERFVATPKFKCYLYVPVSDCTLKKNYLEKLEGIKNECIQTQRGTTDDVKILRNNRKVLQRLQDNLQFCLDNLGLWGAVQAIRILLTGDQSDLADMIDAKGDLPDNLTTQYLTQAASIVESDVIKDGDGFDSSVLESLHDPMFSKKLLVLIQILSSCRIQPDMKCIVFVNRIIVARTLSYILGNLKCLSFWKARFLAGFHSGVKTMSRKNMNSIVEKFRSGELNLLVATRVGEEGLDIQTCCLVIRFDLPETVASFIQSRGRARMPQSEYVFLVESENQSELNLVKHFLSEEDRMNKEITHRTSGETFDVLEEAYYRVPSTGASISAGYSVSLLHCYCSKLPRDEYFIPKPEFFFFDDNGGTFCRIILPSNAPVHEVCSPPQSSKEKAKKIACLTACKELHALGALTDYLLPPQDDELDKASIEFDTYEDEASRGELHEMLSPAALKDPWTNSESSILLNFYYIQFDPVPNDRLYQKFGLFVKDPLPKEAETMELDLHLAHGRIVKTKLVPLGVIQCGKDEIIQAQKFQELFLKLILDREDFFADFVPLGKNDPAQSKPSKFYLLVPVRENKIGSGLTVNWRLIRRCLSSPVFKAQNNVLDLGLVPAGNSLILADGLSSTSDIVNSLVFTPHNKLFFFVDDVLHGIDANSHFADRSSSNYRDHYANKFGIHLLHPEQPLLKAKQLFSLHNLLHNRVQENTEARGLEEHFVELPPELCTLKIIGFSKDIGSSLSLLPSLMHRLENLLVAIELKSVFSHSFPEGSEVPAHRVLEAITTEKSLERFSLERLEVLGDAFLKYAVGRHVFLLHETVDEGQLTRKRSSFVNNVHLYNLAIRSNLPVYIRDENFDPSQFFALGRPCKMICNESTESSIHYQQRSENIENEAGASIVKCSKGHHWLHKKTIADVVEALVGAFIVDSGFKAAIAFLKWIGIQVDFEASQVSEICMASKSYMSLSSDIDTSALENSLGYKFLHKGLLLQAFVHPSYNKHIGGCYQRLEFLGDAVLDYLITSYLFSVYPRLKPGQLTDLRSVTVNNNVFAHVAVCRSFHKYLISDSDALTEAVQKFVNYSVTCSAEQLTVEGPRHPKALGDLVESCVGAILLDSGFNLKLVWKIVLSFLDPIMSFSTLQFNPVRELTELCQSHDWDLQFLIIKKGGAFSADAYLVGNSFRYTGQGTNPSKKAAMRTAAREIFLKLKGQGYVPKKSNSLERLLKSSGKQEAKLIGYDEVPMPSIILDEMHIEKLNVQEASPASGDNTLDSKVVNKESANIPPFRRRPISMIEAPRGHFGEVTEDSSSAVKSQNGGIDCSRTSNDNNLAINLPPFSRRPIEAQGMHYGEVTKGINFVTNTQKRGIVCSPASNDNKTDTNISPARRKPITKNEAQINHYPEVIEEGSSVCKSHNRDMLPNLTAKSHLFEICAANYWKHPVFECVKEEGQAHLKSFIIKVTVEIVEVPDTILECFSDPLPKKKAAEEHAAEGALWYLHHKGYSLKDI